MKTWKSYGNNTAVMISRGEKVFPVKITFAPNFNEVLDRFADCFFNSVTISQTASEWDQKEWFQIEVIEPSQEQLSEWKEESLQWENLPSLLFTTIKLEKNHIDGILYVSIFPEGIQMTTNEIITTSYTMTQFCLTETD